MTRTRQSPIKKCNTNLLTICFFLDLIKAPNQEPALELQSRAEPSVEAHHRVNGLDTRGNSRVRRIKNNNDPNSDNYFLTALDPSAKM